MEKFDNRLCPVARAMDVIGEKWTPLIIRQLLVNGASRFQDIAESIPEASANTLSERLKKLEAHGLIKREFYSDHPPRANYVLTEKGMTLKPVFVALRDWGKGL